MRQWEAGELDQSPFVLRRKPGASLLSFSSSNFCLTYVPALSKAERALIEHQQEERRLAEERPAVSMIDGTTEAVDSVEADAHNTRKKSSQVDLVEMALTIELAQYVYIFLFLDVEC